MAYAIPQPTPAAVPVQGGDALFPVRRIYCVGRNYAAHAREMGSDPTREPPFFFCKPADVVVPVHAGRIVDLPYPLATSNLHYEVELVVSRIWPEPPQRGQGMDEPSLRAGLRR